MNENERNEPVGEGSEQRQTEGPYQHELRRPGAKEGLREREEVGGRAFERPEPMAAELVGLAAIANIAEPFVYPLSREDLLACAGSKRFQFRRGQAVLVRTVMEAVSESAFETRESLVSVLRHALDERSGRDRRAP